MLLHIYKPCYPAVGEEVERLYPNFDRRSSRFKPVLDRGSLTVQVVQRPLLDSLQPIVIEDQAVFILEQPAFILEQTVFIP